MNVNDKRVKHEPNVFFDELKIGQAYEDKDGVLCIKTKDTDCEDNCICFVGGEWEANLESLTARIIPLVATLEIER
jgi:hypothetical protein